MVINKENSCSFSLENVLHMPPFHVENQWLVQNKFIILLLIHLPHNYVYVIFRRWRCTVTWSRCYCLGIVEIRFAGNSMRIKLELISLNICWENLLKLERERRLLREVVDLLCLKVAGIFQVESRVTSPLKFYYEFHLTSTQYETNYMSHSYHNFENRKH